ncbi:hypothetical protein [Lacibacter sediminis]|uniref:Uncharacterized protein n=1 Tax=Lacibacter sediminis TaxID=2760713 RepID=A0A7G5XK74_9BACT|nr:hypothetical protein [Lacibacter sediminis]QNA45877.1 hypothetical protein H4075_06710 [Lacibacter sediminis]
MKVYINKRAAIIGLHERGFTEDFVFSGNNILWVQQKILLLPQDVTLIEFYRLKSKTGSDLLIFGVIANNFWATGVLITHCSNDKNRSEPVINVELVKTKLLQSAHQCAAVGEINFDMYTKGYALHQNTCL